MSEIRQYERSKDEFESAEEAWNDIQERSELVESFDQYVEREHSGQKWTFHVEVEP